MKVSTRAGGRDDVGAEGGKRKANAMQQNRGRLWDKEQGVELSRLLLGFARQHRRLPDGGNLGFWQLCHDIFRGAFTRRQVQAKVRYLHLRFCRLASGAAPKNLRVADRHNIKIWSLILNLISPASASHERPSSPPPTQGGVSKMGSGHAGGNPGVGPAKKGANVSGAAAAKRQEPAQEASTCSTEDVSDYEEEVRSRGEFQNNATNGHATSGADNDETAHNNALLHHLTVADLAAAVKTLAEIVARGPQV